MADDDDHGRGLLLRAQWQVGILMPSDLNAAATAPGELKVYQMSPEERLRYPVERPTRDDLVADTEAGLDSWKIARKYRKERDSILALAKRYNVALNYGSPDPERAAERAALREKIEKEMAGNVDAMPGEETKAVPRQKKFADKLTRAFLEVEIQRRSAVEIGKMVGCSAVTVGEYLKKFNIPNPHPAVGHRKEAPPTAQTPAKPQVSQGIDTMTGTKSDTAAPTPGASPAANALPAPVTPAAAAPDKTTATIPADAEARAKAEAPRVIEAANAERTAGRDQAAAAAALTIKKQVPAKFHKLIDGMLDQLPPVEAGWTNTGLVKWMHVMTDILALVYRLDEAEDAGTRGQA